MLELHIPQLWLSLIVSWVMTTPLQDSSRDIVLMDAYRFGVQFEAAKSHRLMASQLRGSVEYRSVLFTNYGRDAVGCYEREMEWRYSVWSSLEDALDERYTAVARLCALQRVKALIGDEWFYSGWVPDPNPQMRVCYIDK